jgi:hypothetical protein
LHVSLYEYSTTAWYWIASPDSPPNEHDDLRYLPGGAARG